MTVEEIEIIVTAKVEEALKEFQKILPEMTKIIKQAQEQLANVDMSKLQKAVKQQMPLFKKQIQNLKKSIENNDIYIKINNKDAEKQISQTQKQIDSLNEKINARQMKLNVINPQIDKIVDDTRKNVTPEGINPNDKAMDTTINNALNGNKDFTSLNSQAQKLYTEIEMYNKQLDVAKSKMAELKQQTSQTATTQNKLSSFFSAFKQKIEQVKPSILGVKNIFSKMPNIGQNLSKATQSITNNIKGMGTGFKNGLGQVLKYAGALFSLRGIYSALSSSANAWLSSQNSQAKQLNANIEYMKYAMGSALAPVIQFVTNCVYQLLKAVQSVVYALFRVNIFANASASAFKNAQKQAKNTSKSLSSVHSEINNVGDHNSDASPNVGDLSSIDNQMSPLSQKLYDFFKPLVDSWNKYGATLIEQIKTTAGQIASLISSVWESVEKLIINGTVYTSLELILAIIGNIAEAFSNAWNYNDNGDVIVQNLANAFNNLLTAINNVVQSEGFQNWLNNCSDKFRVISEKIASINWQPMVDTLTNIGQNIGTIALDILRGLVDIFKWLVENPVVSEIILGIAVAIGVLSTAYSIWATVTGVLTAVSTALNIAILPLIAIIVAIVAVIALIVVAVMNWGTITEWLKEKWTQVKQFFSDLKQRIYDIFSNIGKWFGDKFNEAKESVMNAFSNIGNWFRDRKNDITNTFSNIGLWFSGKFQDAYNGITRVFSNIGNFFKNIWNDIKNTFTNLGTSIGNAISGAVKTGINGVISLIEKTINTAIRLINGGIKLINLIPGVSVGTINTLNLPRLAKGNVAYDETLAIFGEYSGASNNPEITTPQNIMRDTFEDVLSDFNSNNRQPVHITIQYLGKDIFDDTIDYINSKTRRTGRNTIVTVGD